MRWRALETPIRQLLIAEGVMVHKPVPAYQAWWGLVWLLRWWLVAIVVLALVVFIGVPVLAHSAETNTKCPSVSQVDGKDCVAVETGPTVSVSAVRAGAIEVSNDPLSRGTPRTIKISRGSPLTINAPEPVVTEVPRRSAESIVREAAAVHGVNADQLVRIGMCESGLHAEAVNPASGAAGAFQFIKTTWEANRVRYGYPHADRSDIEASANVAAQMIKHGNEGAWNASRKCWG